ncbi:uncharacterized protein N7496_004001 [Penicillium cataractarum]|uniref:Uncharacterized protein n=1 Tax=Penicillium cataractarum TaxID=2100454 RepID=A0A9W9SN61_9EURO|nr:uncharacterized protein N7496_004001 [Penicillium cataractarum]KAJ5381573.1 hypothetical protein N7496_004001 [Penicillium cataractarum]
MTSNMKSKIDTEASSSGFLGDLGPPIRRYPYKGIKQFLELVKMELSRQEEKFEASECVLFTKVNEQAFSRDFLNSDDTILQRCWNSYSFSEHLLLVKMPVSRAHEIAVRVFERLFFDCLKPMGLDDCLQTFGSATCKAENGSAKQPDCQFLPRRLPRDRTKKWPSVVVETGYSESPSKLMSDARFWLSESNGDVQMVITIKIGRSLPDLVLESWELVNDRVKRQQAITISKGDNNHVYLWGQPLMISFDKLFLRPPSIPKETNISLDDTILKKIARNVWEEQGF